MQQITLTKEELKEIIAKEVREVINGKKTINPNSIFNGVSIEPRDFGEVNRKFDFTKDLIEEKKSSLGHPLSLKKYERYLNHYEHNKAYVQDAHDLIRKLTLSAFGVTLNSDLSESEYSQAAEIPNAIKELYLHLYKKRLSELSIEDFE